jgi:uncharacterized protein YggE
MAVWNQATVAGDGSQTLGPDIAIVSLHQVLHDYQSQSAPTLVARVQESLTR